MKDAEIIKGLEICTSEHLGCIDGCPYCYDDCCVGGYKSKPMHDALGLINRKNAEIDILIRKNEALKDEVSELQLKNASCNAEIERLKDIAKGALNESINICDSILDAKAEAINEFAKRLKTEYIFALLKDGSVRKIIPNYAIDYVVKEMVGDAE